jgi:hypothetical protein
MKRLMRAPYPIAPPLVQRSYVLPEAADRYSGTVGLQRCHAIEVLCGLRQAVEIGRKASLLRPWRRGRAHGHSR